MMLMMLTFCEAISERSEHCVAHLTGSAKKSYLLGGKFAATILSRKLGPVLNTVNTLRNGGTAVKEDIVYCSLFCLLFAMQHLGIKTEHVFALYTDGSNLMHRATCLPDIRRATSSPGHLSLLDTEDGARKRKKPWGRG